MACAHAFSRHLRTLHVHVFALSSDFALLASVTHLLCLARVITFVLVLSHSIENRSLDKTVLHYNPAICWLACEPSSFFSFENDLKPAELKTEEDFNP